MQVVQSARGPIGDLRAVTSEESRSRGQCGPGQHLLKPAAAASSGIDQRFWVNKANCVIFSSEAQLLEQELQVFGEKWHCPDFRQQMVTLCSCVSAALL